MERSLTDQFASVIIDSPLPALDYRVPEEMMVAVGDRVLVPLTSRKMVGVVVAVKSSSDIDPKKIRNIIKVLSETPGLGEEWMNLTRFAAGYYMRSWGEVAIPALPPYFRTPPRANYAKAVAKMRDIKSGRIAKAERPELNEEQKEAVRAVTSCQGFGAFVLFGVTGSGKTEVYLHIMQEVLERDPEGQVLLLVPEINLTPQLESRVRSRFPDQLVVTMHSDLANGKRAANWLAVHEGRARVLVGTRTAIFASFKKLSLILVDEEHDSSYKAGDGSRFSARDLAVKRAHSNAIPCVLGSATPSLETWNKVKSNVYRCLVLHSRAVKTARMPTLRIVDTKDKYYEVFAPEVKEAVDQALSRNEQVIIFINRRGYSPVISCTGCGWVSKCIHCSGFTVYHKDTSSLICHHCGSRYKVPERCPSCGNVEIEPVGVGTQRIEENIEKVWPEARILRIDRDSVRCKGQADEAFASVHEGKVDIIVGTQMIAKGHDFKRVSLVVVLNADAQLASADIRAEERLFATLMQVAGRAGRDKIEGTVMIQTRFANHPIYEDIKSQSFERFAARLLEDRRDAYAPPFSFQALVTAESNTLERAMGFLQRIVQQGEEILPEEVRLYDPVPMTLMRLKDVERAQVLVESDTRAALHSFMRSWREVIVPESWIAWNVEIDPMNV